jgi:exodeoxyribonuclease VII small subunit
MADDAYSFAQTRARLDEIVSQVRKKDTSLEKSLDLLEEGVRLANQCTELIDHADWEAATASDASAEEGGDEVSSVESETATSESEATADSTESE